MKKLKIVVIILDILMVIGLFLLYGPIGYFRDTIITTAMKTKNHKYIARTLYSEKMINKVMSENYIAEINENTDVSKIKFEEIKEKEKYSSKYEEQVLKKDPDNDLYKIVNLKGSTWVGYMVVVYDPSKIDLVNTRYLGTQGEFLENMSKYHESAVSVNAGGFADAGGVGSGGIPTGTVISDGEVFYRGVTTGWGGGLIGFNKDHVLVLTKDSPEKAIQDGMVDAVDFGPFLIVNGNRAMSKGNGGWGLSSRTIIAQRKDGIVLFFVIDGRQPGYSLGIDLVEMTDLLEKYKAYNAANLDGGASSSLVVNGKLYSKPCAVSVTGERWIPNAWMVDPKK